MERWLRGYELLLLLQMTGPGFPVPMLVTHNHP